MKWLLSTDSRSLRKVIKYIDASSTIIIGSSLPKVNEVRELKDELIPLMLKLGE